MRTDLLIWLGGLCILAGTTFDYVMLFNVIKIRGLSLNLSTGEIGIVVFLLAALAHDGKAILACIKRQVIPIALIVGIWLSSFLSAVLATQASLSLKASFRYLAMFLVFVCFLLLAMGEGPRPFKRLVALWGIFMGLLGILEYFSPSVENFLLGTFIPMMPPDVRVGTVFNPNVYGAFMGLVFILGLTSLDHDKFWFAVSTMCLGLMGVTIAGSRNAWLTAGLCFLMYSLTRRNWRWLLMVGLPILIVWGGVVAWSGGGILWRAKNPISLGERTVIWTAALAAWRTSPLIGIGPRAFSLRLHEFVPPEKRAEYEAGTGEFTAHNIFLSVLVEQGLVGFLLAAALAVWLISQLLGKIAESEEVLLLSVLSLPLLLDDFTYFYFYLALLALFLALALEQLARTAQGGHGAKAGLGSCGRGTEWRR